MPYSYTLSTVVPASPAEIYRAWLDSVAHSEMTGGEGTMADEVGADISAWDGYITGTYVKLQRARQILAEWKTSEWPAGYPASQLMLSFQDSDAGTLITMVHSEVPVSQAEAYNKGWTDYYWTPLKEYFSASHS